MDVVIKCNLGSMGACNKRDGAGNCEAGAEKCGWAEATESHAPSGQAGLPGCATELAKIADELQGLAGHIREYIAGDMPTLPILWDIEEVVINYKKVTRPE